MAKPKYRTVQVEVPEIDAIGLDPDTVSQLDDLCRAYRLVQDTPVDFRGVLLYKSPLAAGLIGEPETVEATKGKIKDRLDQVIEPIADRLPERVLGRSWDLRKTERKTRKVNEDRLKFLLLQLGFAMEVECPSFVQVDGAFIMQPGVLVDVPCPVCNGVGRRKLTGLDAINHLIAQVVDESVSTSWSVYKLKETEEG